MCVSVSHEYFLVFKRCESKCNLDFCLVLWLWISELVTYNVEKRGGRSLFIAVWTKHAVCNLLISCIVRTRVLLNIGLLCALHFANTIILIALICFLNKIWSEWDDPAAQTILQYSQ